MRDASEKAQPGSKVTHLAAKAKSRREVEREADQLVRPISKYLEQERQDNHRDLDESEMEEYFSEDEYRSLNNEPNGLLDLQKRSKKH